MKATNSLHSTGYNHCYEIQHRAAFVWRIQDIALVDTSKAASKLSGKHQTHSRCTTVPEEAHCDLPSTGVRSSSPLLQADRGVSLLLWRPPSTATRKLLYDAQRMMCIAAELPSAQQTTLQGYLQPRSVAKDAL